MPPQQREEVQVWCESKPELPRLTGTVLEVGGIGRRTYEFTTNNAVSAFWLAEVVRIVWSNIDFIAYAKVDGVDWGKPQGTVMKLWD